MKRLQKGELTNEEIAAVTAKALRAQADEAVEWNRAWGDFVQFARKNGALSDQLWRDYLLGAVRIEVRVAAWARRSSGLQIGISQTHARTGKETPEATIMGIRQDDLSGLAVRTKMNPRTEEMNLSSWGGGGYAWTEDLKAENYAALELGAQIYHYHYRVQLLEKSTEGGHQEKVLGERSIEGKIPWQLLAEDAPPLAPAVKTDPALRAAIAKSIRVQYILRDDRDKTFVQTSIQVDHPLTGLAFEVGFRVRDQTLPLGPVAWTKGNTGSWAFDADLPENSKSADLVFTPSADAAARLATEFPYRVADLTTIWGGEEIIVPGVRIQTQRVGMRSIEPPSERAAFEYALAQMDAADSITQQMKRAGETKGARSELEQKVRDGQGDVKINYELGCILTADGDLRGAMACFIEAQRLQPAADLSWQIRRQQRRICSMWLKLAESDDAASMEALASAYEHGWGVGVVLDEAKRWYLNASNDGNAGAMCRLAAIYDQKIGATIHNAEADEWYQAQALEWYRKSATLGNDEAKQWLTKHDH